MKSRRGDPSCNPTGNPIPGHNDHRRNLNGIKLYTFTNCLCDDSRTYQPFRPLRIAIKGLDYFYLVLVLRDLTLKLLD